MKTIQLLNYKIDSLTIAITDRLTESLYRRRIVELLICLHILTNFSVSIFRCNRKPKQKTAGKKLYFTGDDYRDKWVVRFRRGFRCLVAYSGRKKS